MLEQGRMNLEQANCVIAGMGRGWTDSALVLM